MNDLAEPTWPQLLRARAERSRRAAAFRQDIRAHLDRLGKTGARVQDQVDALNADGIKTHHGKSWTFATLYHVLHR
jgi:hypothetical protein